MIGKFCCPNCGSGDIQSYQMVLQSGTSTHSYKTTNDRGETEDTSGTQITGLAASVTPPAKKETYPVVCFACYVLAALNAWGVIYAFFSVYRSVDFMNVIGAIFFGLVATALSSSNKENEYYNKNQYPKLYEDWLNSYVCFRCGHRFVMR